MNRTACRKIVTIQEKSFVCCEKLHFCGACLSEKDFSEVQEILYSTYEKYPEIFEISYNAYESKDCGRKLAIKSLKNCVSPSMFAKLPDKILVNDSSSKGPVVSLLGSDRPATLEELSSLCQQAPVGKGEFTVFDLDVRKVKQVKENAIVVSWEGMREALSKIMNQLVGNSQSGELVLREEFHKLLIYEEGDFFEYHRDSKKSENHVFTLAVDCGYRGVGNENEVAICEGGEVYFSESYKDEGATEIWKSTHTGDWCCWFTTEPHKVAPITKGRRVIATYNIMMEDRSNNNSNNNKRKLDSLDTTNNNNNNQPITNFDNNNNINNNNPIFCLLEEMKKVIISKLNVKSLFRLSSTCKAAYSQFGGTPIQLLTHHLNHIFSDSFRNFLIKMGFSRLGFLFHHMYSFDGKEVFDLNRLHGRDYILMKAVQNVFGATAIEEKSCQIIEECREEEAIGVRYRIVEKVINQEQLSKIHDHFYQEYDKNPLAEDKSLEQILGKSKFKEEELDFLNHYHIEIDDDPEVVFVPFLGVLWLTYSNNYFHRYAKRTDNRQEADIAVESLWGNEGCFSIYSYRDVGLIVDIAKRDDIDLRALSWDKDYLTKSE